MTVTDMHNRKVLVGALIVCSLLFLFAEPSCVAGDQRTDMERKEQIALNLGLIRSITVPASWKFKEAEKPEIRNFLKRRTNWWDCVIDVQIASPVKISAKQSEDLATSMHNSELTRMQIDSLNELPGFRDESDDGTGKTRATTTRATTVSINGRRLLMVEHRGQTTGPCESMGGGRTRMPMLSYVRGSAYVITDSMTMQTIRFNADVMGNIDPCMDCIRTALNSIEWTK